jgi:dihydroorotate dehydrogenase (NAD+) catalytic subunit
MTKNIQTALNDWHINVVSEMKINDPSKLAEYALHISRIVAYDHLVIKDELSKIDEIGKKIVSTVRVNTNKPISVKVGVGSVDVVELSRIAIDAGANMITAINTLRAMSIDVETMMPILSNRIGGLSGSAIKPIGIRCVYEISKKLKVPVIGCGGVSSWQDVIEYMIAGASAVQIGSVLGSSGPRIFNKITQDLKKYVEKKRIANISEIIGIAHRY